MNQKLIILDDEKDVLDSYRCILSQPEPVLKIRSSRRIGTTQNVASEQVFDITYVQTGEAALEAIANAAKTGCPFVGGFFDVKLGSGIDGVETIRQAKTLDPHLHCVIVTAFQDRSINEIRKILGEDFTDRWDYLCKPFSSEEIAQKASHIVASWNRISTEKQLITDLETRQQRAAIIRDLLDDLVTGIQGNAKQALGNTTDPGLKKILNDILHSATDADQIVSESFQWMSKRLGELITESANKARMENELETARLVQSTLLTIPEVRTDQVDLLSHYTPASECGGDLSDVSLYKDKLLTVIIGDATGHGAPAALLTAIAKSSFSTLNEVYSESPLLPEQFLGILNESVYKAFKGQFLMTMCICQVNLESGELSIANAGHESPICLRAGINDELKASSTGIRKRQPEVLFTRGERLGFSPGSKYCSSKFQLAKGDTLLLYTDGISEATDVSGKEWGERALKKVFSAGGVRPLKSIHDEIMRALNAHIGHALQRDDITFVLLNWKSFSSAATNIKNVA